MTDAEFNRKHALEHAALHRLGLWPFTSEHGSDAEAVEIRTWQAEHDVLADGKAGAGTWAALRDVYAPATWLRRLPRGLPSIVLTYGDVGTVSARLVQSRCRPVLIHPLIRDEFDAAFPVAVAMSGYEPASVQTYNRRRKRGGKARAASGAAWSTHAWAIAFDADPGLNPWGNRSDSPLVKHPAFCAVFRALGWSCGVDWSTPDTMHLQACSGY